jgi:hypothetical protein
MRQVIGARWRSRIGGTERHQALYGVADPDMKPAARFTVFGERQISFPENAILYNGLFGRPKAFGGGLP